MRNELPRRHAAFVLAAFVLATAFPMTLTLSRDGRDGGERPDEVVVARVVTKVMADSEAAAAVPTPSFAAGSDRTDAATQTASMMLVGTLLIGIGTVVRRVA